MTLQGLNLFSIQIKFFDLKWFNLDLKVLLNPKIFSANWKQEEELNFKTAENFIDASKNIYLSFCAFTFSSDFQLMSRNKISNTILVRGLPIRGNVLTRDDLLNIFERFGKIELLQVPDHIDSETKERTSFGYCFVRFENSDSAEKAFNEYKNRVSYYKE